MTDKNIWEEWLENMIGKNDLKEWFSDKINSWKEWLKKIDEEEYLGKITEKNDYKTWLGKITERNV